MTASAASSATSNIFKFRPDRGVEWPDYIKELAFQSWAFLDNHNCAAVALRFRTGKLAVDMNGDPLVIEIPDRTVQDWAKDGSWDERHERFIQQSAGGILKRVVGNMMQVALDGSHAMAADVKLGIPPSKEMVEAVKLASSVIGLSAIGSRDPSKGVLSGGSTRRKNNLDLISDDELLEMERQYAEPE